MRLSYLALFLTLVVEAGLASPNDSFTPSPIDSQIKEDLSLNSAKIYPMYDVNMQYFAIGLGTLIGAIDKDKETKTLTLTELTRSWRISADEAFETGLGATSNNLLAVDLNYTSRCCFKSFANEQSPYYKIGLFLSVDAKDKLANFIDYQRLFVQAGFGIFSFASEMKYLGGEVGARSGYAGSHVYALLRYRF